MYIKNPCLAEATSTTRVYNSPHYEDIRDVTLARVDDSHPYENITDTWVAVVRSADCLLDILSYMELLLIRHAWKAQVRLLSTPK